MSEKTAQGAGPVLFSEKLANSQAFAGLFKEGMALVEETASYLDGPGRQESKKLDRSAALAYATESMRLTTRLMQLASWLLLHRAVKEGEMSLAQANKEKTKVKLSLGDRADADTMGLLPEQLRDLIDRSLGLLDRVRRLDATMPKPASELPQSNAGERQLGRCKPAFEREARYRRVIPGRAKGASPESMNTKPGFRMLGALDALPEVMDSGLLATLGPGMTNSAFDVDLVDYH